MVDDLTLLVGGRAYRGWTDIRVTRGVERIPSDFAIAATERYPGELGGVLVQPGAECQVLLGDDVAVTGYVDRYSPSISKRTHSISISGRGRCQDLTDCSAYLRGVNNQMLVASTAATAEALAGLFGISVTTLNGRGRPVPQFNVILNETGWDVIERVARHSSMLAYEGADGGLVLAEVGTDHMSGGFREGINVENASVAFSMDQRFSLYEVVYMPIDILGDVQRALDAAANANSRVTVTDDTVPRFRPKVIIAEQGFVGDDLATKRANWEKARRYGRSQAVRLTTDSWRDVAGRLWEPNTRASVHLPSLRIVDADWVISEVTYSRGREGTHAELVLMPPEALMPEPILLQAYDAALANDLARGTTGLLPPP
jgi:prophage tail gpP-like protein